MENLAGGYIAFRQIAKEEIDMFNYVMKPILGVQHKPLAVATQVVSGTNYAYLCESTIVYPNSIPYNTLVIINKPFPAENKPPMILEIREIKII